MSETKKRTEELMNKALLNRLTREFPNANKNQLNELLEATKKKIEVGSKVSSPKYQGKVYTITKIAANKRIKGAKIFTQEADYPMPLSDFRLATDEEINNS